MTLDSARPAPTVVRRVLSGWVEPEAAYLALYAGQDNSFWLDAGLEATRGFSYLGATLSAGDVFTADLAHSSADDILENLQHRLGTRSEQGESAAPLGLVGWLGYEAGSALMGTPAHPSPHTDAAFLRIDRAVEFDHAGRTVSLVALADGRGVESWLESTSRALGTAAATSPSMSAGSPPRQAPGALARLRHSRDDYLDLIAHCQREIAAGNAYLVCLTSELTIDRRYDPVSTYLRLRRANPGTHGGLLRIAGIALLSSSPEQFLKVTSGRRVTTRPIKGTRRRGTTAAEDADLMGELTGSEKERAENLMIVDLMRNDLERVATAGSVRVQSLFEVESYENVHQLVSTIVAELRPELTALDVVRASFPAGSMTGAPKHSAMSIIDALESGPRGLYAGAFGYFCFDGSADLAMTIRSIVLTSDRATIGTGGGITALSIPAEELDELFLKAAPLLLVLDASVEDPQQSAVTSF